ncbi:MAG TPA: dephospho-CoA kinase, partial [Mammaliicoccus lentus]
IDGEMNRQYIGQIVFNDENMRNKLNNIIHPKVREIMEDEKQQALNEGKNVIMDIPLLFENQLQDTVDETWLVYTNETNQINRLKERNQLTDDEALSRIRSQIPIEEKRHLADETIENNGTKEDLESTIIQFLTAKNYKTT